MTSKTAAKTSASDVMEVTEDMRDAANEKRFDDSLLRALDSVEAVEAFLAANDIAVESLDDYGSGFAVLDNKDSLIGKRFIVIGWQFRQSKQYGNPFVVAFCMTDDGDRFIVVDGSTGINKQLREITDDRISRGRPNAQQGLAVPRGLKRSDYTTEVTVNGKTSEIEATTYYLA